MFERLFIKRNKVSQNQPDLGKLCETLLFYNQTDFLLDRFTTEQFVKSIELEKLKFYSDKKIINLHYKNSAIGLLPIEQGKSKAYAPFLTHSDAFDIEKYAHDGFTQKFTTKGAALKNTNGFLQLCTPLEYTNGFQQILDSECGDSSLVTSQLKVYIKSYLPQLDVTGLTVEIEDKISTPFGMDAYVYKSNFDLDSLNKKYSDLLPKGHSLNWQSFLLSMYESSGDLNIATQFNSELYTDVNHYPFIQSRVSELINKSIHNYDNIELFENHVLKKFKPIRDVINSGEKTFEEFTSILDKSIEFKKWLKGIEYDSTLLDSYYEAITKDSWIDKKSIKALRFSFFTGVGIMGDMLTGGIPIFSLASSLSDSYLLPKIVGGWKPNQFIDNSVKPFLEQKN